MRSEDHDATIEADLVDHTQQLFNAVFRLDGGQIDGGLAEHLPPDGHLEVLDEHGQNSLIALFWGSAAHGLEPQAPELAG